ncbi:MAG: hypothetical protein D6698_14925 [Gammaproteobacteria bacterium]|nr:MAG: hypothetical protein D6698_14925 [Gammaproteobacteria bacterium]
MGARLRGLFADYRFSLAPGFPKGTLVSFVALTVVRGHRERVIRDRSPVALSDRQAINIPVMAVVG